MKSIRQILAANRSNDNNYTIEEAEKELLNLFSIRLSLPDTENIDYLRGFIDGYGGEEPHGVMPDGFNDINEVWDKLHQLKGK